MNLTRISALECLPPSSRLEELPDKSSSAPLSPTTPSGIDGSGHSGHSMPPVPIMKALGPENKSLNLAHLVFGDQSFPTVMTPSTTSSEAQIHQKPRHRNRLIKRRSSGREVIGAGFTDGTQQERSLATTSTPMSASWKLGGSGDSSSGHRSEQATPSQSSRRAGMVQSSGRTLPSCSIGAKQLSFAAVESRGNTMVESGKDLGPVTAAELNVMHDDMGHADDFRGPSHHHLQHHPHSPLYPPPPSSRSLHKFLSTPPQSLGNLSFDGDQSRNRLTPGKSSRMPSKRRPPTPAASAAHSPRRSFAKSIAEANQNYTLPALPSLPNATDASSQSSSTPLPTLPPPRHRSHGGPKQKNLVSNSLPTFPPSIPAPKDECSSQASPMSSLYISSVPVGSPTSTNVTTATLTTAGLASVPSLPNIASSEISGLTGSPLTTTGVVSGAWSTKIDSGRQPSSTPSQVGLPAVSDETMRSLWKEKGFASTAPAQLAVSHTKSEDQATSSTITPNYRPPHHLFKPSLATPLPSEISPPIVPTTLLPSTKLSPSSSSRNPPPAPLNLSRSMTAAVSPALGASSANSVSAGPPFTPCHRREGSLTQYANYPPPAAMSGLASATFTSSTTPNVPSSSATITFPASTATNPADPQCQLPQPSPTTPARKLSMKRLLSKPAPPSPSVIASSGYSGYGKTSSAGSSPHTKRSATAEGRRDETIGSSQEESIIPESNRSRRPSALTMDEPGQINDTLGEGMTAGNGDRKRTRYRERSKSSEDKPPGNIYPVSSSSTSTSTHAHTSARPFFLHSKSSTSSKSPKRREGSGSRSEPEDQYRGQRRRTSSDRGPRERSSTRSRREKPPTPSLPSHSNPHTNTGLRSGESTTQSPDLSAKRTQHVISSLNATSIGNQFVALDYEPPSPSLGFSLGSLGIGRGSPTSSVPREKTRSKSPFEMAREKKGPLDSGRSSRTKNSPQKTPSMASASATQSNFDLLMPRHDRLTSAPTTSTSTHGRRSSALLMDVENALGGLAPRREEKAPEEKEKKGRMSLLKKASRKFGSEGNATPGDVDIGSPLSLPKSKSTQSSPAASGSSFWFSLGAPAPMSAGAGMTSHLLDIPQSRSRSFSRERRSPGHSKTDPLDKTRSNPASRSSSVSREATGRDAHHQAGAPPSTWQSPVEWMSGPQATKSFSPPTSATSPKSSNSAPPVPTYPFRSNSTPNSRANSLRLPHSVDDKSQRTQPSLPGSASNSRAPSRLAESAGAVDVQSAFTNALSSNGTGTTSGRNSPVVFVPMMLMDGEGGENGHGGRGKAARLSVVAIGEKKEKKPRKEKKERVRTMSSHKLTPAASLIEEYKQKEMERERDKAHTGNSMSRQQLAEIAKNRRSKSLVGLRDMFFGSGESPKHGGGDDATPPVELSHCIQPSPQPSREQTTDHKHTHTERGLLRESFPGLLSSSVSDGDLRGSFAAGESMQIDGNGGSVIRDHDQIRMMFAGGAVETGEDGGACISDDDIFTIERNCDTQPPTPHHTGFGVIAGGSEILDPRSKEKRKEGLTQTLGRKVSITKWRKGSTVGCGSTGGRASDQGHASAGGYFSERESRAVKKMHVARRRVSSVKPHDSKDKGRRSLRLSIDKFPDNLQMENVATRPKKSHQHSTKAGKSLWRMVRGFSVSTKDRPSIPPPPVPALPDGVPSLTPRKKSRSHSRKATTRSSSPPSSSDHASSSFHHTQSVRSSTSSVYEAPPPLPKLPSTLIGAHIIKPGMLDSVDREDVYASSAPSKLTIHNDRAGILAPSQETDITSLPLPPRRASVKPRPKTPKAVSANTPRPSSMSMVFEPSQDFDDASIRSGASGSPIIPTFSTEEPINAFPKRLSGRFSKASPVTPGSTMTGTNTSASSPLDVNGEPIPISLQVDPTTFVFPPSALISGPVPPRPTRSSHRPPPKSNPVRPRVHTADVPVDVQQFSPDSTSITPTSVFQKYANADNPAKFLYRKSSGGLGVGSHIRGGQLNSDGTYSHSRKRSSSYGGEGSSSNSSPLSQSPVEGQPMTNLPPPPSSNRQPLPSMSTPPDSFSRYTSHSASTFHRPSTANTFGPSTLSNNHRGQHESVMNIFDIHRSASNSSTHSSSSARTAHPSARERNLRPNGLSTDFPMALHPSVSSLRSSMLLDSESLALSEASDVVRQAERVVLHGRAPDDQSDRQETSGTPKNNTSALTDDEKRDRWDELIRRSERAGGTLTMSVESASDL